MTAEPYGILSPSQMAQAAEDAAYGKASGENRARRCLIPRQGPVVAHDGNRQVPRRRRRQWAIPSLWHGGLSKFVQRLAEERQLPVHQAGCDAVFGWPDSAERRSPRCRVPVLSSDTAPPAAAGGCPGAALHPAARHALRPPLCADRLRAAVARYCVWRSGYAIRARDLTLAEKLGPPLAAGFATRIRDQSGAGRG